MFFHRAFVLNCHRLKQNVRYYNHFGKYMGHTPITRSPKRIQIRSALNQAEERFTQEFLPNSQQTGKLSLLIRPFLFTIGLSAVSVVGATVWEYEYVRSQIKKMMTSRSRLFPRDEGKPATSIERVIKDVQSGNWKGAWDRLSVGDHFFLPILAANVLVYALWRLPRLQPMLLRNFSANPYGHAPCRSMLLSTFSHYSFFHIFANMYVLNSFSNIVANSLGREQSMVLYLSAGCFASLASYINKVVRGVGGMSLGASGAVIGVLAYSCLAHRDSQVQVMFLPQLSCAASDGLTYLIIFDLIGLAFRWRIIDHAAHLGGAFFGIFWYYVGDQLIWGNRKYITEKLHEYRKSMR